jgi:hypothetical protein
MQLKIWALTLSASVFSIAYAFVEYYVIRDTTFGYSPVMLSLVYPYHFVMAAVFGLAAYSLLAMHGIKGAIPSLILTGALFSSMLVVEDFTWFSLRAVAPLHGDSNAGKLIAEGEWTTRFMGSTDAYFTAIPNWYFASLAFSAISMMAARGRRPLVAVVSAP